jgi:hypothetical protein
MGLPAFMEGKKNYDITKEMVLEKRIAFRVKLFKMCHKCLEMFIPSKDAEEYFTCPNGQVLPDATTTPYAHQQILLLGNYSVIPEFY